MTHLPLRCAAATLVLAGCSTITPMQTASVVDPGHFRVGGQLSFAAFCGDIPQGVVGLTRCVEFPDGIPLPELRANGRYGITKRLDVGVSVQGQGQVVAPNRVFQLGVTADIKGELFRVPTSGPTHLMSAGFLTGAAAAGRLSIPLSSQFEWGLPIFYGLQFKSIELVANVTPAFRHGVNGVTRVPSNDVRLGFSLGVFRRNPAGLGIQLSYLTDPLRFSSGAIQLQLGFVFDVK
jgi:hypothetical protein